MASNSNIITPPASRSVASVIGKGTFTIKDIIAPSYVEVDFTHLRIDDKYYRTIFVSGYPRYVNANWLHTVITFEHPLYISMFVYPTEAKQVVDQLKNKIAEMEASIESDMRAGKPVDPGLQTALDDAMSMQAELAKGAERFFQFALYITIPADTKEELEQMYKEVDSNLSALLIIAKQATLQHEEGFKSCLPMFTDKLQIWRNMDTTSLAMTFPFSTASLTKNEGILYGLNQHDGSLIIFDRFTLENSNEVVLGKSGGGKSFYVKLEALRLLMMGIEVIIIDPDNEYASLASAMGGEFFEFSRSSPIKINPFDLIAGTSADPDELPNKVLNLHTLMRVIMGDLTPAQDALLDRALVLCYREKGITQDPETFNREPPMLEDLFKILMGMESAEGRELSDRLEKFVKGSAAGIFNAQSNFSINNQLTVFGIRELEDNLRPVAMYIVLDYIWNIVRHNQKKRVLIVDEAWYLVKNKDSGAYLHNFAKRARKYKMGMTTLTQDVEDFLSVEEGKAIITNSSLQVILKQSTAAVDRITQTFYLTGGEKHFLMSAGQGEGLFFAGQQHVGFKVIASEEERQLIGG